MPTININIANKIATNPQKQKIICGNSDYTAVFTFDAEWNEHKYKTARFNYNGAYEERIFEGNAVEIPVLSNTYFVEIGVYAGDLRTTTGAVIECAKSVLCRNLPHGKPSEDVYNQLMKLLNDLKEGAVSEEDIQKAVNNYLTLNPVDVSGVVIYDGEQILTEEEKTRARANIGAISIEELPKYAGEYIVNPSDTNDQTLETAAKFVDADITVKKIPYAELQNTSNGTTVIIGE